MIDFSASNWFDQYVAYRQQHPLHQETLVPLVKDLQPELSNRYQSLQHPFYLCLQKSGLIYGFPIHYPFQNGDHKAIQQMPPTQRAKVILLDTMLHAQLLEYTATEKPYSAIIAQTGELIKSYYDGIHEFGLQQEPELIEDLVLGRIKFSKSYLDFQKSGINSQLFWDLYFFLDYTQKKEAPDFHPSAFFSELVNRKKETKELTLRALTFAALADQKVVRQEKKLIRQFLRSSQAHPETKDYSIPKTIDWDTFSLPENNWLARRFLLDITLLTLFADGNIDDRESTFLQTLVSRLSLSENDLMDSEADLGCFLYNHGKQLHFYAAKETGLQLLARAAIDNFTRLAKATKLEYVETRDMAGTFSKLLFHKLNLRNRKDMPTPEEIKEAINQLKDIPRFLPFFSMAFLPVPGITEVYILLAVSLEKFSGGSVSLLPSQFRKIMHPDHEEE